MEQTAVETGAYFGGISTFGAFLINMLVIFLFVVWFWILIRVMMDLFRRKDVGGFAKVLWVIFLVVLPYLGIFAYLLTQSRGMSEREVRQAEEARDQLRSAIGFSVADEIVKLDDLKASGKITDAEYSTLRGRLV